MVWAPKPSSSTRYASQLDEKAAMVHHISFANLGIQYGEVFWHFGRL